MTQERVLRIEYSQQYPWWSIVIAVVLILVAPFVSVWLKYAALAICVYRVLRYEAKVFATDYALLAPLVNIFRASGGLTLLIVLCLIAAVVYVIRESMRADRSLVLILVLLNYFLLRMQGNFNDFVLCFGQMFLLWVLLPKQNAESAERTAKVYCVGLLLTSGYALLLRDTWQLQAQIGVGTEAIWGTGIMRFHGLVRDPNFYMTEVIVALALLIKLRESNRLKPLPFVLMGIGMTVLGVLTYSKTFFLVLLLLGTIYIIWQFWKKKIFWGIALVAAVLISADFLLLSENSPFAVVLSRLRESEDLNDLTTGRLDVYTDYLAAIVKTPWTFFFGYGFAEPVLARDPHNIYLEMIYYCGVVGIVLVIILFAFIAGVIRQKEPRVSQQNWLEKYIPLLMVMVLYFSLNGIFMVEVYPNIFLAFLSIYIVPKEEA